MNTAVRVVSCLMAICFCTSSFAQTAPSLAQLQEKAKQQVEQTPWIKRHAVPLAAVVAAGGALTINQLRLAHRNKVLRAQTQKLAQDLKDYQHYTSKLSAYNEELSWKLEQTQSRLHEAQASQPAKTNRAAPKPAEVSPTKKFMPLAKTDLSKRLLTENASLFAHMTEEEAKFLLRDVDLLARQNPAQAVYSLNRLIWEAPRITHKQIFIVVEKYIKGFAVTALLVALAVPAQDARAGVRLNRLEQNPALFLQADAEQLKAWEKDPRANALCRRVAEAIDRAASLDLSDQEAQALTRQAAEEVAAQQAELSSHLRKQLAR